MENTYVESENKGCYILSKGNLQSRRSIRLKGFDYSQPGAYFITMCTYKRLPVLSRISDGDLMLKTAGEIVRTAWQSIPDIYANAQIDESIIMPNHFHGIIILKGSKAIPSALANRESVGAGLPGPPKNSNEFLGKIIGRFKYITTREINILRNSVGQKFWQRNYYEHIIRNEEDLRICREYMANNPAKWHLDRYYQEINI